MPPSLLCYYCDGLIVLSLVRRGSLILTLPLFHLYVFVLGLSWAGKGWQTLILVAGVSDFQLRRIVDVPLDGVFVVVIIFSPSLILGKLSTLGQRCLS